MKLSTKLKIGVASVAASAVIASGVYAGGSGNSFNMTVAFVDPFTVTENTPIAFTGIMPGVVGDYSMDNLGAITVTSGGVTNTGSTAGDYTITDSGVATGTVDITVDNTAGGTAVSVTGFNCDYGGAAGTKGVGDCTLTNAANPGNAGTHLTLGPDLSVTNAGVDGTSETISFDITVAYN